MLQSLKDHSLVDALRSRPGLAGGAAAILLLLALAAWWVVRPSNVALVKGLPEESRGDVLSLLMDARVPYEIDPNSGDILVPASEVEALRVQLSQRGLMAHRSAGLELFGEGDYGMSEFAQGVNYQRALQGELERTVQSIEEVRQARVHVTLGKASIFEDRREPAKASIALHLKKDRSLTQRQVQGIRQLAAAAVPALEADHVVVVDEMGRTLSSGEEGGDGDRQDSVRRLEQDYENRARVLISGVLPEAQFRLSVKLDVNFDKKKTVKDNVVPAGDSQTGFLAKRREQSANNQTTGGEEVATTDSQTSNSADSEYVFSREHSETEHAVGVVERVSVGIVASEQLTGPKIAIIRQVLFAGLGMTEERGDSLSVAGVVSRVDANAIAAGGRAAAKAGAADSAGFAITRTQWGWAAFVLLIAIIAVALRHRMQNAPRVRPLLSAPERDVLLQDVRRWLATDQVG